MIEREHDMRDSVKVLGMVLSAMPMGEYDKRLLVLTRERGKISVFAKGARKPNSVLLACSQPFTFGTFEVYEGKNAYTLLGAEISNYFQELRLDLSMISYGLYFCEFADYYSRENVDETDTLKLLYQTLRVLAGNRLPLLQIRAVYELKMIVLNGEGPQVYECQNCGEKEGILSFSLKKAGMLCDNCIEKDSYAFRVNTSTLYAMQYITSSSVEKLFSFSLTEDILQELAGIVTRYRKAYVEHTMKSEDMLQQLEKGFLNE